MLTAETQLSLEADEAAVVASLDAHGGLLVRDEADAGTYWVVLRSRLDATRPYYVRVSWQTYPGAAPSVRFADGVRGSHTVSSAWPNIPGYRLGAFDICKPFTAEGYIVHPEWATGPNVWRSTGNPFLWVVELLQYDLHNHYQGRNP
jgi:hypothetical protein